MAKGGSETYTCPACNGPATVATGCRRCGRPYDPDAANYAMLQRAVAKLEVEKARLDKKRSETRAQYFHALAQRDALRRRIRRKLQDENGGQLPGQKRSRLSFQRGRAPAGAPPADAAPAPEAVPAPGAVPPAGAAPEPGAPPATAGAAGADLVPVPPAPGALAEPPVPARPRTASGPRVTPRRQVATVSAAERLRRGVIIPARQAGEPLRPEGTDRVDVPGQKGGGRIGGAEATTGSMQTVLLSLGGLLLAGAAVVLTVIAFTSVEPAVRIGLLALVTVIALAFPVALARNGLAATAETVAAVGLLLVLLDGYVVRSTRLFGTGSIQLTVYLGLICLITAGIAAAYRSASGLQAPRFATVLVLQPVIPLLTFSRIHGPTGWALVLAGVAALNLGFGVGWPAARTWPPVRSRNTPPPARSAGGPGTPAKAAAGAREASPASPAVAARKTAEDETEPARGGPAGGRPAGGRLVDSILHDLTWVLFALAYGAGLGYGTTALATSRALPAVVGAAATVMLIAAIGVVGAIAWRRGPLHDISAGIATLAMIASVARVGATALPGHTLLFSALAIAVAALIVLALPESARRGPRLADAGATAFTAIVLLAKAVPAIIAPLAAATPVWNADLAAYSSKVADAAGPNGWQVAIAGVLLTLAAAMVLPPSVNADWVIVGAGLTMLTAPATLGLSPLVGPAVVVATGVAIATLALRVPLARTAWVCLAAAGVLGGYAAAASLTRPAATAMTLAAISVAGSAIAFSPRTARTDAGTELAMRRLSDAAGGGALFALPGAAAAGTAALIYGGKAADGTPYVLVASFLTLAVALGVVALAQLARGTSSQPLLIGATLATLTTTVAALVAPGATWLDAGVGLLMVAATVLLWLAPSVDTRKTFGQSFSGADAAAAAVTVAAIAALARAAALVVPGTLLVTVASLVLLTAGAIQALREQWRRGPVAGATLVGGAAGAVAAGYALSGAVGVIHAASPIWHARLGTAWQHAAGQYLHYGAAVPVALLLLMAAALIALPEGYADGAAAALLGLAAVSAPVGLGLNWTTPMLLGWATATGLGCAAALARSRRAAYTRLVVAGALAVYTVAASLVRPSATAGLLLSLALSAALVAGLSAATAIGWAARGENDGSDGDEFGFLKVVGGASVSAALIALPGAVATTAYALGRPSDFVITAALGMTAVELAAAGMACWRLPDYLPFVSGGVAAASTMIVLVSVPMRGVPTAVFAAAAALIGVLAELMRAADRPVHHVWRPGRDLLPGHTVLPLRYWRPVARPGGFAVGVAASAGIPTAVAVSVVVPAILAALFGPYRWVGRSWTGTRATASDLGWFEHWRGSGSWVLAAFVLTLAAALVALGLGGDRKAITNRAVAVVVPGVALTALIAPVSLRAAWPLQPTAALLVATLCGLSLALTDPAPRTRAAAALRASRRIVFVIAVLAAGAGMTGSLATRSQIIAALTGSIAVGLTGALGGHSSLSRFIAWQVAAGAAELLALAVGLAAGLPLLLCSYPILMTSGLLLGFAGLLPRLHRTNTLDLETMTIESVAYAGAVSAVLITIGTPMHTASVTFALGAVLGLAAARPGRPDGQRTALILAALASELIAIWVLMSSAKVDLVEAYTLPFALVALIIGVVNLGRRPDMGSWVAYGPALVAGFAPTLVIVLTTDASQVRRVLLITVAVATVAIGAIRRQKAPVMIGGAVTAVAMLHELILLGRLLPWPILLVLFSGAGILLVGLGATYEKRRQDVQRIRGAIGRMR